MMTTIRTRLSEVHAELKLLTDDLTRTKEDGERRNLLKQVRLLLDRADKLTAEMTPDLE